MKEKLSNLHLYIINFIRKTSAGPAEFKKYMDNNPLIFPKAVGFRAVAVHFENLAKKEYIQFKTYGINGIGLVKKEKPGLFGSPTTLVLMTKDVQKSVEKLESKGVRFTTKPQKMWWGGLYAEFIDPDRIKWGLVEPIKK